MSEYANRQISNRKGIERSLSILLEKAIPAYKTADAEKYQEIADLLRKAAEIAKSL